MLKDYNFSKLTKKYPQYQINIEDYESSDTIGRGTFATVKKFNHLTKNVSVAMKIIKSQNESQIAKCFCREVSIMASTNNPFLIHLHGFTLKPYRIAMPFMVNGSLDEFINENSIKPCLTPTQKTLISIGIANGMASFHKMNLIHRDLKPGNVLIDENFYPVISDFGISREFQPEMTQNAGTFPYMAPESFQPNYTNKIDVYSYGMILYKILENKTPELSLQQKCDGKPPKFTKKSKGSPIRDLIRRCIAFEPNERPSFEEISEEFRSHSMAFEDTDEDEVDAFFKYIDSKTQNVDDMDIDEVLQNYENKLVDSTLTEKARAKCYKEILDLVLEGKENAVAFSKSYLPQLLTFTGKYSSKYAFALYTNLLIETPEAANAKIIKRIVTKQSSNDPYTIALIVGLYYKYLSADPDQMKSKESVELFIAFCKNYIYFIKNKEIDAFLRIASFVYPFIKDDKKVFMRMNHTINHIVENGDDLAVYLAIHFSINMSDSEHFLEIPYEIITNYCELDSSIIDPDLMTYIANYRYINDSNEMGDVFSIQRILECGQKHSPALYLLLDLSLNQEKAKEIIECDKCWTFRKNIPGSFYYKLINQFWLYDEEASFKPCLEKFNKNQKVLTLLGKLIQNEDQQLSLLLCGVIKKFFKFYESQDNSGLLFTAAIETLKKTDFIKNIVNSVIVPIELSIPVESYRSFNTKLDSVIGDLFYDLYCILHYSKSDSDVMSQIEGAFEHVKAFICNYFTRSMKQILTFILEVIESSEKAKNTLKDSDIEYDLNSVRKSSNASLISKIMNILD